MTGSQHNVHASDSQPRIIVLEMYFETMKNYNYLVLDSMRNAVIIDPAWEMHKIEKAVSDNQANLRGILVTHSHPDHLHLALPLSERFGCPIRMSRQEIAISGFTAPRLVPIESTPWCVGRLLIEPILTPGHTPGGACYRIGRNLFTGDVLFAEGCGICPDTAAAYAMFSSLENLKAQTPADTRIYPGHSYGVPPGQRFAQLLKDNIYLQFSDKHSFAAFRLRKGQNRARMFTFS